MSESYDVASVSQALAQMGYDPVDKNAEFLIYYKDGHGPLVLNHGDGRIKQESINSALNYELIDPDAFWAHLEAL